MSEDASPLLRCVEIEPQRAATSSVIWLHGLGADGHDFEPIVPYLGLEPALGVRFVFPHAPRRAVTINAGLIMPAWYDIRVLALRRDVDEQGVLDSSARVRALLERENGRGVPYHRIVLAGFSQGAAIALHVALRYPERLAGVVALSTYLVREETLDSERHEANRGIPIFQAHGTVDEMVPIENGQSTRDRLIELGYPVVWKTYPMGHEVNLDEIRDIGAALNRFLAA